MGDMKEAEAVKKLLDNIEDKLNIDKSYLKSYDYTEDR